jgi:endonuclease/exonuclease/phosphatase (EEP) superfamily protein YafD
MEIAGETIRASFVLKTAVIVLAALSGIACLERVDWRFELLTHWRVHYAVLGATLAVTLGTQRRFRWAGAGCLVCAMHAPIWLPLLLQAGSKRTVEDRSGLRLRIVSFNVYARNTNYAPTIQWIQRSKADVVILLELTSAFARELDRIDKTFSYHYLSSGARDGDRIGVWSTWPLLHPREWRPGEGEKQSVYADIVVAGNTMRLIAAHVPPPLDGTGASERQRYLARLGLFVGESRLPVVAAGDFNSTPWSQVHREFISSSRLSRAGGWTPTWPAFLGPAGIPIDHVFGGNTVEIVRMSTGPRLGSDHLPLIAEVLVPPAR